MNRKGKQELKISKVIITSNRPTNQTNVRTAHLLFEQQAHAVHHLVPIKRRGCDVEEEPVENRLGDPLQRNGQHEG